MDGKILFVLFISVCCCFAEDGESTGNFEYPCESTDDWDCIRDFLASTGQCTKVSHKDGVPIKIQEVYDYVPKLGVDILCLDTEVAFFGSKIVEFYMNKDTNNLVMTLDFDKLTFESQRTHFYFQQLGQEPLEIVEYANMTYSAMINVIIAWSDFIANDDLRATGFLKEFTPSFVFGPKITESNNELVQNALTGLSANTETCIKELWLIKAYYYTCAFINHMLCDFGYEYDGRINRE